MALIKCPDCARDISDEAPACPGCGRPIVKPRVGPKRGSSPLERLAIAAGCVVALIWLVGRCSGPGSNTSGSGDAAVQNQSPAIDSAFTRVGGQGLIDFVLASHPLSSDADALEARMRNFCDQQRGDFCQVMVWRDRSKVPDALPMSQRQLNAQVAQYNRNRHTGYDCVNFFRRGEPFRSSGRC